MNPEYNTDQETQRLFDNRLWDIKTASLMLSVPEGTLRDWVYKRRIPFKKLGNLIRFDPREVRSWIDERSNDVDRGD